MNKFRLFLNLIKSNLKRLRYYIPAVLISVCLLLGACLFAGNVISKNIYKENPFSTIKLAYYLPDDQDLKYNMLALSMLEKMNSIKEAAELIRVSDVDQGYQMLEQGDVLYYIIVPDNFFTGIMDSTNPPLNIVVRDNSNVSSFIANELLMSYARYLGIAQAGIYSALDTSRAHGYTGEQVAQIQDKVNVIYLERALNKDGYIETIDVTNEGSYTLLQHYIAVAVMLTLFFITFVSAPLIRDYGQGITDQLRAHSVNHFDVFINNMIVTMCTLYIGYLPCVLGISVWQKAFHVAGLYRILPALLMISLIINIINIICRTGFIQHMVTLVVTLGIAYIGGGILPSALLPAVVQELSKYMPGEYIISAISQSLFGM